MIQQPNHVLLPQPRPQAELRAARVILPSCFVDEKIQMSLDPF